MKVSLNTIKELTDVSISVDELVDLINRRLGGVEEITDLKKKYEGAVIVRVVSCEKHPDADKLSVCKVDDAGAISDVPRDEQGYVQVVCGAPNVHADMYAIWLPPRSTVPASFDETEPFILDARKLRGVLSQGMLAASDELAIGVDHDGIVELRNEDLPPGLNKELSELIGASFAHVFGLDDVTIDIENKMFTHRPDLFGQIGVAREIAGIQGNKFESPEWYTTVPKFQDVSELELTVENEAPEQVPRLMAVAMNNVTVKPSPLWLQCELVRLGGKPINNVVDVTNYIMLMTAQPVHAYDYDKLRGHTLMARMASEGEKVTLLNQKSYTLTADDIVIADAEGPIGLAGIMGGGESEVSAETKNIVLEVATFDMYTLRKSSMRHGVFTDALTRFNKGQSPLQNAYIIQRLIHLMKQLSHAEVASEVYDRKVSTLDEKLHGADSIELTRQFIGERLGLDLSEDKIASLLRNVEFATELNEHGITITPPFWRTDIELPEDIVEEVGRLYGFDTLPRVLPSRTTRPAPRNAYRDLVRSVRTELARAGANEVLTYSFVHKDVLEKATQDPSDAYALGNALSPDLQYYRLSLTPSLLDKVYANIRAGYDEFALFEVGKSHSKKAGLNDEGLPFEPGRIALTYTSKSPKEGAAYYHAKDILEFLLRSLKLEPEYKVLPAGTTLTAAAPFDEQRSARVIDTVSGQAIGIIGEYKTAVRKKFKLPEYTAGFELFTEGILLASHHVSNHYKPASRYPSVERDVCFELATAVSYADLIEVVAQKLTSFELLSTQFSPLDIYQGESTTKRITLRIKLVSYEETLTHDQVSSIINAVCDHVIRSLNAKVI